MELPFATGFYRSESLPFAAQRCVNWIPVVAEQGALSQRALFDVPGLISRSMSGDAVVGHNRGGMVVAGVPYFVNGQNLYSFTSGNVVTDHGTIDGFKRVSMASNDKLLVIVAPGLKSYVFDTDASTLTQITDPDFIVADTVVYKDGLFTFSASDGSVFFHSNLNQPLVIDALDFGTADVRPDKILACHVSRNELFVLGEITTELFQNIGGDGFVYQRVPGGNIDKGIHGRHTLANFDSSFVFVGGGENELSAVWKVTGAASVQKISTAAIDTEIQKYTRSEIADAHAFSFAFGGNYFVAFTFTSKRIASKTFVFDATTSAQTNELTWHERQSGVTEDRWRVSVILSAYDKLIAADLIDGSFGTVDKDTFTEYGNPIYRQKNSQPFYGDGVPLFISELKATMEAGTGLQEDEPQLRMSFSDDGGRTFGSEFWRTYGKQGAYDRVPTWTRQGKVPRARILRFVTTEPVRSNFLKLDVNASQGVQ